MAKKNKPTFTGNSEHRKNFIKLLEQIAYDKSPWNVFNDFLQLAASTLSNQSDPYFLCTDKKTWDEREKKYLDIFNSYSKKAQELFPQMYAELVLELESYVPDDYHDVLGEIFHEMEFQNQWRGQFFTPQHVCNMMGLICFDEGMIKAEVERRGFVTMNEPAVGAGALIYGAMNAMKRYGFNPTKQFLVIAGDIDERCVLMCYIQCSLYELPAIIRHQNSLTGETFGAPWITPVFNFDGWIWRYRRMFRPLSDDSEPAEEVVPKIEEEETALKVDESGQFCLF